MLTWTELDYIEEAILVLLWLLHFFVLIVKFQF